jgi:hypothetical protein
VRPYLRPHVFAVYDRNDPRPLIVRYGHLLRRGLAVAGSALGKLADRKPGAASGDT